MARKINLGPLFNSGELTITVPAAMAEDASSDGLGAMFDNDETSTAFTQDDNASNITRLEFDFNTPIQGNQFRLEVKTTLGSPIHVDPNDVVASRISSTPPSTTTLHNHIFIFNASSLRSFNLLSDTSFSNPALKIFNIELFVTEEANPYEFNDSVLSTKAWNSSRYDGRQLSATTINEFNEDDTSYGGTPVIRNSTRTFYTINEIVSLNKSGSDADDKSLQFIPNFSYALVDQAITVNADDTIELINIGNIPLDEQKGMQREFQSNVKAGDNIGLINFDSAIKNRSNARYPVYFNRGRLQPILRFTGNSDVQNPSIGRPVITATSLNLYAALQDDVQGRFDTLNENLLNTFYTGSVSNFNKNSIPTGSAIGFFNQLSSHRDTTDTRFFLTVVNTLFGGSVNPPIRTIDDDAISTIALTKNLAEISTTEIMGGYGGGAEVNLDSTFPLNRIYNPTLPQGAGQYSGSFDISILNEEKPSVLINMDRETEFPDGRGSKPTILIPSNLHPFIQDNLTHFSAKAGLDIGDRKVVPELNETNRNLP